MRTLRRILTWGRCPQTPGIFRFAARMNYFGERVAPPPGPFRPLSRRSGCVPAVPYPPLRYSQSGRHQPRRATILQRTAITPLTSCLTPGVHFKTIPRSTRYSASLPPRPPFFFRIDSPCNSIRCAACTKRSRMLSATVGSPICACHFATGNWLVNSVDLVRCCRSSENVVF